MNNRTQLDFVLKHLDTTAFWQSTERQGNCIVWTGKLNFCGYGYIHKTKHLKGDWKEHCGASKTTVLAHRLSYIFHHNQAIPSDKNLICHHCDNPKCVNPYHLYAGTSTDNVHDKVRRGRIQRPSWCYSPSKGGIYYNPGRWPDSKQ